MPVRTRPNFGQCRSIYLVGSSFHILEIQADADEGIDVGYLEQTLERATGLLRSLADLYWRSVGDYLPAPSIGPAVAGSIDLFWERSDLTLLINVPRDPGKAVTFFGRRLEGSKISGVLGQDDSEPRHLTGWLMGEAAEL
jgi:hypothetical protein